MASSLPRSRPADRGVDPAALLRLVEALDTDPEVELHSLMVLRHGHVVAEGWWAPHTPERTRLVYSLSKSFTATALGFALEEGLLGLDDPVVDHFAELADDIVDRRSRAVTVRHVASMSSGHDHDMIDEALERDPNEPVRGFLLLPPQAEPGTLFAYSQPCTYTLASILQRAAGMPLTEYLRPRLFDPLGIGAVGWLTWPPGREQGFSGLFARTEDVAKLGQLYLQRGRWEDAQLLPESYVELATSRHVATPDQDNVDWRQGYGFCFWMARHGYRGDGAFGQFCVVLPEHDVVVATTGGTEAMQTVLDLLWENLLPGLDRADVDDGAVQEELEARLRGLRLPPCIAQPAPAPGQDWAQGPVSLEPSPGSATAAFRSVEVRPGTDGLELTLAEQDNALTFPVGATDWLVSSPRDARGDSVPVAASGGWLDDGSLRVEVVFLESPHRIDVTCVSPAGPARAVWRIDPLGEASLELLHRPS
jgi:CubicO group peptidase (beta-lactamase class C family)